MSHPFESEPFFLRHIVETITYAKIASDNCQNPSMNVLLTMIGQVII